MFLAKSGGASQIRFTLASEHDTYGQTMFIQSSSIRITRRPHRPAVGLIPPLRVFLESDGNMEAVGSVTFAGRHGEKSPAGWTVGFLQAQWIDTSWGLYRGNRREDGSVFVQRSRPPARPCQSCIDTTGPHQIFYGNSNPKIDKPRKPVGGGKVTPFVSPVPAGAALPLEISALHSDHPFTSFEWDRVNGVTGQVNQLREAQWEMNFCTVLVARDPQGKMHMLRGFYWNVACQATIPDHPQITLHGPALAQGTHAIVGHVFAGPPTDPRFLSALTRPQTMTCNDMLRSAAATPNVREAKGWPDFDVRR